MTTTIEPTDEATETEQAPSTTRVVLSLALAVFVLLAAGAGVVFVLVNDPPAPPTPVVEAVPAPTAPSASATPEERFLTAWHTTAPEVAARRGNGFWARVGTSTCTLIGRPFVTEDLVVRVLGSNPRLMSADEGRTFLGVAHTELCPQNDYAPELQWPTAGPAPQVDLPDLGSVTVPRAGSVSIPTKTASPPSVRAPRIPRPPDQDDGTPPPEPSVRPLPDNPLRPQPLN